MTTSTTHPSRLYRAALGLAALTAVAATAVIGTATRGWIGTTFPGFFLLSNRVIPSVGLSGWSGTRDGAVYQRTVVAMDGAPVANVNDVYRRVADLPPGRPFAYTFRHGASTETLELASQRFTSSDYSALFGAYLVNGVLYLLLGVLGAWLLPEAALGRALLFLGSVAGIFALSAATIYGPESALRVHALAEAFFPATLIYLAVVFPSDRGWLTKPLTALGWWLSLALAVPYQFLIDQPGAYSILHEACEAYLGIAGVGLIVTLIIERARAGDAASGLVRAALAGALLGLGVPAVVMTISGFTGGALPVNIASATAFLFPACFAFGLLRERFRLGSRALAPSFH